jgi:hypothetical protein
MTGQTRLSKALQALQHRRLAKSPDCQQPDAPADLPTTHGLQLASIEGRLTKLEAAVTNQNRLLLIGVIAILGEFAKQLLHP